MLAGQSLPAILFGLAIAVIIQIVALLDRGQGGGGRSKDTFGNALKLWLLYIVVGIGIGLVLGVAIPVW